MRRIACLVLGALLGAAGPAHAQATAEDAAKLKAAFEAWMPSGEDLTPKEAEYLVAKLSVAHVTGQWQVTPDGDGYDIRSPGSRTGLFKSFWPFIGRIVIVCDPDRMRATPMPDGRYALSGETPAGCRVDRGDDVLWTIAAEHRRTEGIVDPGQSAAITLDTTLDRVTVGAEGAAIAARIGRVTISLGNEIASDGSWTIRGRHTLEEVSVPLPNGAGSITADKFTHDTRSEGVDIAGAYGTAIALARHLAGLTGQEARTAGDNPAIREQLDQFLGNIGRDAHMELRAEGLAVSAPMRTIRISTLALGAAMTDFSRDDTRLVYRLDHQGLSIEPPSPYAAWIPTEGTMQVTVDDIPAWTVSEEAMLPGKNDPFQGARTIAQSPTRLSVDAVHLAAPDASLDLTGTLRVAPDTVRGKTGTLQLRLAGMDGLVAALQADPKAGRIATGLTMLQTLGRQTTLPNGASARDYDIVIDPSGKILVNGTDVQAAIPKDL